MPVPHMVPATRHITVARSLVGSNSVTRDVVTGMLPDDVGGTRGAGRGATVGAYFEVLQFPATPSDTFVHEIRVYIPLS